MKSYRVLIVDDDELVALQHKLLVENIGHHVVGIVDNGKDALTRIYECRPDIVLMDIVLSSEIDGIEVGGKISSELNIPIIYVTAYSPDNFIERARATEPYGYLIKPISERELSVTISIGVYKANTDRYLKEISLLCESMESICEPVVSLNFDRQIMFLNSAAKNITIQQSDLVGEVFQESHLSVSHQHWLVILDHIDESIKSESPVIDGSTTVCADVNGQEKVFNILATPLRNKCGEMQGVVIMFRDITRINTLECDLRQERDFINDVLNTIDALIVVLDLKGTIISINNACIRITDYQEGELIGHKIWDKLLIGNDRTMFKSAIKDFSNDAKIVHYESKFCHRSPGELIVSWSLNGLCGPGREIEYFLVTGIDVTARKINEQALLVSEQRFRDVVEAAGEFVWETDEEWRYTYVSERMKAILGYPVDEVIGLTPAHFFYEQEMQEGHSAWPFNVDAYVDGFRGVEHEYKTKSGDLVWLRVSGAPIINSWKHITGFRGVGEDITERKIIERKIEDLATRDVLTHLPNRLLLNDRVSQGIFQAQRSGEMLALFFIDLDQFKHINDSLGHDVGDMLLVKTAARLVGCVRQQDTVSRLGGDEFIVILCGLNSIDEIIHIAQKILSSVSRPLTLSGYELIVTCSIGISLFPSDGVDIQALMSHSDTAMYHAKNCGRNNFQFYSSEMNVKAIARQKLETNLRISSENNNFHLFYQPKVDIETGLIVGVEALLRWNQSVRERVSPDVFIPVAERIGLINHIGEWVLQTACEQNKKWRDCGYQPIKVAVNLSVVQIGSEIITTVDRILQEVGLEHEALDLEITENLMMDNIQENIDVLDGLRKMGVSISMDDFGTGYSSLSYLKSFPLDTLKIDKSFIHEIALNQSDVAIVGSIITMAKSLGLNVLAEGVESKEQLDILGDMGCNEYQGYYFGRPMSASDFERKFLCGNA